MRKLYAALTFGLLALGISIWVLASTPERAEAQQQKPNFIVINTDDLDKYTMRYVPKLENTIAGSVGMKFNRAHVTVPACCPSRASFFTGQYVNDHGVFYQNSRTVNGKNLGSHDAFRQNGHERDNLATNMQDAGYRTGLVGKYINHYEGGYVPRGWDYWHAWTGAGGGNTGDMNQNGRMVDHGLWTEERDHVRVESVRAEKFVKDSNGKPFMLVLPTKAPHNPAVPTPKNAGKLNPRIDKSGSYNERNVSDKPRWVRKYDRISKADERKMQRGHAGQARTMLDVQEMVLRLRNILKNQGRLSNTYFIFTSDNGYKYGQHRLDVKLSPYKEDVEVPFLVRGPGVMGGVERNHMVSHTDIAPTILDLAGAPELPDASGRSLEPHLTQGKVKPRHSILTEYYAYPGGIERFPPTWRAIETRAGHKYVRYPGTGERELYLPNDPNELRSRDGEFPKLQRQLDRRLDRLMRCETETCKAAEGGE